MHLPQHVHPVLTHPLPRNIYFHAPPPTGPPPLPPVLPPIPIPIGPWGLPPDLLAARRPPLSPRDDHVTATGRPPPASPSLSPRAPGGPPPRDDHVTPKKRPSSRVLPAPSPCPTWATNWFGALGQRVGRPPLSPPGPPRGRPPGTVTGLPPGRPLPRRPPLSPPERSRVAPGAPFACPSPRVRQLASSPGEGRTHEGFPPAPPPSARRCRAR
ncbi:hypothetical protein P175DRAFT_0496797 [Aspergillus ochraceoroseus IBT 24754]|uniref:Uncharacterized protein n=1 Tax=Aspergillus ochraceoroseus IBT 24754 TaxID=1392256 RepID=A0A2T5LKN5_9EURO|nr:uncharacterized protein P175DRAFT_0496797 [Aspergillus ochraceoroseus IBT 24754]PTU16846.1 hypothetical protein P175DRAFT_0496797 [Aspergillus ochraceoroseus IBT 24754]